MQTRRLPVLLSLVLASCVLQPLPPEELLLRETFAAIRDGGWERYSGLSITTAALLQQEMGIKPGLLLESQSFTGMLKKEQKQAQRQRFERVRAGGAGFIDFERARFLGVGTLLASGTLSGLSVPFQVYSIRIELDGKEIDTRDLYPRFVVVPWAGSLRIFSLEVPASESED